MDLRSLTEAFNSLARAPRKEGTRAPHKPLLILFCLSNLYKVRRFQLLEYEDVEGPMTDILHQFNVARQQVPEQPFTKLKRDSEKREQESFWELTNVEDLSVAEITELSSADLKRRKVAGGLNKEVVDYLLEDPTSILKLARDLLEHHFPSSLHREICATLELPFPLEDDLGIDPEVLELSNQFRYSVTKAYAEHCAFCGGNTYLGNSLVDMEATYIKWPSHGGPYVIKNGLLLCIAHHNLFDRGAIGLERRQHPISYNMIFAPSLRGAGSFDQFIEQRSGKPIILPADDSMYPNKDFVEWHLEEVFRSSHLQ